MVQVSRQIVVLIYRENEKQQQQKNDTPQTTEEKTVQQTPQQETLTPEPKPQSTQPTPSESNKTTNEQKTPIEIPKLETSKQTIKIEENVTQDYISARLRSTPRSNSPRDLDTTKIATLKKSTIKKRPKKQRPRLSTLFANVNSNEIEAPTQEKFKDLERKTMREWFEQNTGDKKEDEETKYNTLPARPKIDLSGIFSGGSLKPSAFKASQVATLRERPKVTEDEAQKPVKKAIPKHGTNPFGGINLSDILAKRKQLRKTD